MNLTQELQVYYVTWGRNVTSIGYCYRIINFLVIIYSGVDDLADVLEELLDVSHKWYNIGLKLKVSLGELDNIEYKELDSHTSLRRMLTCWLKQIDPLPTWEALADALESRMIGESKHGQRLRSKYCTEVVPGK